MKNNRQKPASMEEAFEYYVKDFAEFENLELIILKGHLITELMVSNLIVKFSNHSDSDIIHNRYSFSNKIKLLSLFFPKKMFPHEKVFNSLIANLYAFNELRNEIAHNLTFKDLTFEILVDKSKKLFEETKLYFEALADLQLLIYPSLDKKKVLDDIYENPNFKFMNESFKKDFVNDSKQAKAFFSIATIIGQIRNYYTFLYSSELQVSNVNISGDLYADELLKDFPNQFIEDHPTDIPKNMEEYLKKYGKEEN